MHLKELTKLGLTLNEASVYMACLAIGAPELASKIARKAKIDRELCYSVLKTLRKKGLIKEVSRRKMKHFSADSPQQLVRRVEKNIQDEQAKLRSAQDTLQELILQYNNTNTFKTT